MFLFEPDRTAYDLNFRMFGTPVRIHPMFWLIGLLFGADLLDLGFEYLLLWIGCIFVSILIHELGHVWMGQVFGTHGHIVLYSFGGLAVGSSNLNNPWKRIAVYFAGPLAGFLLLVVLFLVLRLADPGRFMYYAHSLLYRFLGIALDLDGVPIPVLNPLLDFVISSMIFINLFWGLINLLPIWPLDGGQISRDLFKMGSPRSGLKISLGISFVIAGVLALHSVLAMRGTPLIPFLPFGGTFMAIFFALFAVQSFILLQQAGRQREWGDWRDEHESWRP